MATLRAATTQTLAQQGAWKGGGPTNRVAVGPKAPQEKTKHLPHELLTHMTTPG